MLERAQAVEIRLGLSDQRDNFWFVRANIRDSVIQSLSTSACDMKVRGLQLALQGRAEHRI